MLYCFVLKVRAAVSTPMKALKFTFVQFSPLLLNVCVCVYVYMCICVYVYMCICVYVYMCICVYVYMCICVYVYMCICVYVYMCICVYVYMCICMYMRVCVCVVYLCPKKKGGARTSVLFLWIRTCSTEKFLASRDFELLKVMGGSIDVS